MAEGQQRKRRVRRRRRRRIPYSIFVLTGITFVLAIATLVASIVRSIPAAQSAPEQTQQDDAQPQPAPTSVSFCAVGDNLINAGGDYTVDLLGLADSWSGTTGDGSYDFSPLYKQLADFIQSYDIAFVNQETTLGGNAEFDYQGYPAYNTPDELIPAIRDAGFDVVNCGTNHTYDTWTGSIEHSLAEWAKYSEKLKVIGSYASEADREDIRVLNANGMKIAFLSYCYGQNGYEQDDLPNDYYVAPFDKAKMREEIARAKALADAVVVYMHWGDENNHEISDQQAEYASFLAGQGVDLTIGSHAHVIQPVEYVPRGIRTTDGSGADASNGMLCVYGLGDFVSGYTLPKTVLSGMFTCEFVRDENGDVTIDKPMWHGLIEHNEGNIDTVYRLSDYTDELANRNTLLARVGENDTYLTDDPLAWIQTTTREIVGDAIYIDL